MVVLRIVPRIIYSVQGEIELELQAIRKEQSALVKSEKLNRLSARIETLDDDIFMRYVMELRGLFRTVIVQLKSEKAALCLTRS